MATHKKANAAAATLRRGVTTLLGFALASVPLYPAIKVNLDAAAGQGETWAIVGIGFVIFCALAVENSLHALRNRQGATAALWGVLGMLFVGLNCLNAIANFAGHSDHTRDENRTRMQVVSGIATQRTELAERRKAQALLAGGEASPESIEAQINAEKASHSSQWKWSQGCDPAQITLDATKKLCSTIAGLEAKKAAAMERDKLTTKLEGLEEKAQVQGVAPSTVDSFADSMADGLAAFGYQIDEKAKLAIVRARDWAKSVGVELLAAFGPTAIFGFLASRGHAPVPMPKLQPVRVAVAASKPRRLGSILSGIIATPARAEAAPQPSTVVMSESASVPDPIEAFISRRIERCDGAAISADQMRALWEADCKATGADRKTPQLVGRRLSKLLEYDRNNGRPRYMNVRIKAAAASSHGGLRLAVSNT